MKNFEPKMIDPWINIMAHKNQDPKKDTMWHKKKEVNNIRNWFLLMTNIRAVIYLIVIYPFIISSLPHFV